MYHQLRHSLKCIPANQIEDTWFCFDVLRVQQKKKYFVAKKMENLEEEEERNVECFSFCEALKEKYCSDKLDDDLGNVQISGRRGNIFTLYILYGFVHGLHAVQRRPDRAEQST